MIRSQYLLVGLDDLYVVMIEQVAGGVIELRYSQLETNLRLNETQLRLGKLVLASKTKNTVSAPRASVCPT